MKEFVMFSLIQSASINSRIFSTVKLSKSFSIASKNNIFDAIESIKENNHALINPLVYRTNHLINDMRSIMDSYNNLSSEHNVGNRSRSYSRVIFNSNSKTVELSDTNKYFMSDGISRNLGAIDKKFLNSETMRHILHTDFEIASGLGLLNKKGLSPVGVHQIRFTASFEKGASFASPIWLHQDDEKLVFVHLINVSENCLGGDSLLSSNYNTVDRVFRLNKPLETLALTSHQIHAVTPIDTIDYNKSVRDTLIVALENGTEDTERKFVYPKVS